MEIIHYRNKLTGLVWEIPDDGELAGRLGKDPDYERVPEPRKPRRKGQDGGVEEPEGVS